MTRVDKGKVGLKPLKRIMACRGRRVQPQISYCTGTWQKCLKRLGVAVVFFDKTVQ